MVENSTVETNNITKTDILLPFFIAEVYSSYNYYHKINGWRDTAQILHQL